MVLDSILKWAKEPAEPYQLDGGPPACEVQAGRRTQRRKGEERRHLEMWVYTHLTQTHAALLPCFPSPCPVTLPFCFPAQSMALEGRLPSATCTSLGLTELETEKLSLQPSAWLSASPWQSVASWCSVTFWGTSKEISSWLNNESKNQFVERVESNKHTN